MVPVVGAERARRGRLRLRPWRVALGLLTVIALSATATVVAWHHEVIDKATAALSQNKSLAVKTSDLAPSSFGGAETLLLVGNDQRVHTTTTPVLPHSNEMLLVRIDPSKPWISMMSLPRELDVPIDTSNGVIDTRLNAALMYGGMGLMLKTIKQVTGLAINHVVEIDFNNFVKAVNEMGCVYSTIDRRYYHMNVPGAPPADNYTQVNLQPGYQRLCGSAALQFVSFRHGDTSQVRDARDQDFLLSAKQQYGSTLLSHSSLFEQIFGQLVTTDNGLHTSSGVSDLLGTLIDAAGLPVRQVHFNANLDVVNTAACGDCDSATQQQITASVNSFLYGTDTAISRASVVSVAKKVASKQTAASAGKSPASPYIPTTTSDQTQVQSLSRTLGIPVWFPTIQVGNSNSFPVSFRSYQITAPDGHRHPIYVAVFSTGMLGQYYDVQGTSWTTAPILDNPSLSVRSGGRTYYLYVSSHKILQVAWFTDHDAYWVRNTLTNGLTNAQMLAVAEQSRAYEAPGVSARRVVADAKQAAAPAGDLAGSTSTRDTLGTIAGILAVLVVGGLGVAVMRQLLAARRTRTAMADGINDRLDRLERHVAQLVRINGGGRSAARTAPSGRRRSTSAQPMAQRPAAKPPVAQRPTAKPTPPAGEPQRTPAPKPVS